MAGENPCTACSWTPDRQRACDYESQVCLFYGISTRGVWSLGSQYILKDRENQPPDYDAQNTRFLRQFTTIPVPETVLEWDEPKNRCLRIVKRLDGITLEEAWPNLSESERHGLAKQTCSYLAQLRKLQSNQIESLDHRPLYDPFLFSGGDNAPHGPLKSDDELWDEMVGNIKHLPKEVQGVLKKKMPPATPYTFTHGDLSQVNIIVKGTELSGIIDWEGSGYLPRWWEFVKTLRGETKNDAEWKALLREHMGDHGDNQAVEFWQNCYDLRNYPKLRNRGEETLAALYIEAGLNGVGSEKE